MHKVSIQFMSVSVFGINVFQPSGWVATNILLVVHLYHLVTMNTQS